MCSERRVKVERSGGKKKREKKKDGGRKRKKEKEKKKRSLKKTWRQGIDNVSGGRWVSNFEF